MNIIDSINARSFRVNQSRMISAVLYIVWALLPISHGLTCPDEGIPSKCHCKLNENGKSTMDCTQSGLRNLTGVPPASSMRFEDNLIQTLTKVPYNESVEHLYLISNGIETIYDGSFSTMTGLRNLNLEDNRISCLSAAVFQGLTSLQDLVLRGNPLYFLRADTFVGTILPSLESLYLDHCHLYDMEERTLDTLSNLTFVSMGYNHLRTIPVVGCRDHSLDNLKNWELSHNEIETLHNSDCHLPNLEHLYLNFNNIQQLNASFLGNSKTNIKHIHLAHNQINYIDNSAFEGVQNLSLLDLSYNQLTTIHESAIPWKSIESVLIHDNPWNCDCHNHWLVDTVSVAKYNSEIHVRCASPEKWRNYSVVDVDEMVFKSCTPDGPSAGHVAGVVIGTIFAVICVMVCSIFAYRLIRNRRRASQSSSPNPQQTANPSKSSVYRRMGPNNGVTFDRRTDDWSENISDIGPFEI